MSLKPILIYILSLFSLWACKGSRSAEVPAREEKKMRILGYYHSSANWLIRDISDQLPLLTDLNLAFVNPDQDGKFTDYPGLSDFVNEVRQKKVRIFFSIGGGSAPAQLATQIQPANRAAFIRNICSFLVKYNFDGVDIDLENELINADYGPFVKELAAAVKESKKLISAAVARWNADQISNETLALYDFLNIMSYDKTGPWRPDKPGQHAPFEMAATDFLYFHKNRGIPSHKLFIGLPFYGYGFGRNAPESMTYRAIVSAYPGAESTDELKLEDGGTLFYNGIATIRQKTAFAVEQKAGGLMIWQIRGDALDNRSLLKAIHAELNK